MTKTKIAADENPRKCNFGVRPLMEHLSTLVSQFNQPKAKCKTESFTPIPPNVLQLIKQPKVIVQHYR